MPPSLSFLSPPHLHSHPFAAALRRRRYSPPSPTRILGGRQQEPKKMKKKDAKPPSFSFLSPPASHPPAHRRRIPPLAMPSSLSDIVASTAYLLPPPQLCLHNFTVTPPHQITPSHSPRPPPTPLVIDAGNRPETVREKLLSRLCHVGPAGDGDILNATVAREARDWGQRDGGKRRLRSAGWLGYIIHVKKAAKKRRALKPGRQQQRLRRSRGRGRSRVLKRS